MDTTPAPGTRVRYTGDERVFVTTDESTTFGMRDAVRAYAEDDPDGERFWLLVDHCEPVTDETATTTTTEATPA